MEEKFLTHENGAPVTDNTNSLTAGKHGPILLEDAWLIEIKNDCCDDVHYALIGFRVGTSNTKRKDK